MKNFNCVFPLFSIALRMPQATALVAGNQSLTFGDWAHFAAAIARFLQPHLLNRRVGLLATRSIAAYAGLAGAAWAGAAYVPLNLKWPAERLARLMETMQLDALVVDKNGAALLTGEVLAAAPRVIIRADDAADVPGSVALNAVPPVPLFSPAMVEAGDLAYILFTSGTTGMPKGVMVSAGSLAQYLAQTRTWTLLDPNDRVAEAHDLTFDLSVHNLFLAIEAGAELHLMSPLDMMAPQRFIRAQAITCWMSVPTIITMMMAHGALKTGVFPKLRLSIFCGEPLPVQAAEAWADAAPNTVIENIYGPTECTVVCMRQRYSADAPITPKRNIVAIGTPYENFEVAVLGPQQQPVEQGTIGEIALCSDQLSDGYFNAAAQTADRFRMLNGKRWYLTGDLGLQDAQGVFHHMGRADNQVKLKGNRVELEEVEMHLRRAAETELACVVAWPVIDGSAQGLVGFTAGSAVSPNEVQAAMMATLPRYMVPGRIMPMAALPQNANGKTDRKALAAMLDDAGTLPETRSSSVFA
jgi:D-alanine--poly(phosphoribitol) ligase subunit 1